MGEYYNNSHFSIKKLKIREVKSLAQGHRLLSINTGSQACLTPAPTVKSKECFSHFPIPPTEKLRPEGGPASLWSCCHCLNLGRSQLPPPATLSWALLILAHPNAGQRHGCLSGQPHWQNSHRPAEHIVSIPPNSSAFSSQQSMELPPHPPRVLM